MTGADGAAGPDARPGWRWDVALSFAGAQRPYVEQVASALKARGVRCFYDADEQIELWGKYLAEELPAIYAEQAAAAVVFVSAEYAARDWTRLERRAALNRAVRERQEYVLPARFDDTQLPGLLSDMVAVDLRGRTPQQFAAMIAAKLVALAITPPMLAADAGGPDQDAGRGPAGEVRIGEADPRRLGVHAAVCVPVPEAVVEQLGGAQLASAKGMNTERSRRVLSDALRAAQSIDNTGEKASALAAIAGVMAATDPDRAERLIADAMRVARGSRGVYEESAVPAIAGALAATDPDHAETLAVGDGWYRGSALVAVAGVLAATDPDRAERLTKWVPDGPKASALVAIAEAVAATDPDRAARLTDHAERIAQSIPNEHEQAPALAAIAKAVAGTDPDRAERIAQSIPDEQQKAPVLAAIAEAVAGTDPDRAERLIADAMRVRVPSAIAAIAKAVAATDPDRAERMAQSIPDEQQKAPVLAAIAEAVAATDPDRAERVARSINYPWRKSLALAAIARTLA